MDKPEKIALYGGTFDPIHMGHLLTGYDIMEKLGYDRVIYIPDNIPVHKKASLSKSADRLKMVKMSVQGIKGFDWSDIEIKRGGYSYTYNTVMEMKKNHDVKYGIIFGDDLLGGINKWKKIGELQNICELVCLKRNNKSINDTGLKIKFFENRVMEISSTEIRGRIANGLPIKGMVTPEVMNYISRKKLYRI